MCVESSALLPPLVERPIARRMIRTGPCERCAGAAAAPDELRAPAAPAGHGQAGREPASARRRNRDRSASGAHGRHHPHGGPLAVVARSLGLGCWSNRDRCRPAQPIRRSSARTSEPAMSPLPLPALRHFAGRAARIARWVGRRSLSLPRMRGSVAAGTTLAARNDAASVRKRAAKAALVRKVLPEGPEPSTR